MNAIRTLFLLGFGMLTAFAQAQVPFQKVIELPTDTLDSDPRTPIATSDGGYMFFLRQDNLRALVKLDQNGDLLWSNAYPVVAGEPWFVYELVPTTDGGAVMLLESADESAWGLNLYHVRLARIDASGALVWTKRYNLPVVEFTTITRSELMTNGANEFFVRMSPIQPSSDPHRVMKINGAGDVLWCTSFDEWQGDGHVRSLYPAQGGGCLMVNWSNSFSNTPNSVSLFDGSGNLLWGRSVRMTNGNWLFYPGTAIQSSTGEVYLLGYQMGMGVPGQNFGYMVRIALNGDLDWYKIYGDGNDLHYAEEVVELPSGDLRFGSFDVNVFDTDGNHLSHQQRSFPEVNMGVLSYSLPGGDEVALPTNNGFLRVADWTKTDDFFGYSWYKPVISVVPWDLNNTCGWDSTAFATASDTIVPPAFIEYLTLNDAGPASYSFADTATVSFAVPLTLTDFCTLLSVDDVDASATPVTVFPSLLQAGTPINVHAQGAARMELFNARGRSVQILAAEHDAQVSFNSSTLRSGLYLIRAVDAKGALLGTARVVVE